jgi:alpha-acetolactate decarboxylase
MGVLTGQIIIRMYDEPSNPVRTPSYIPQITFYFLTGNKQASKKLTLFGRFAHHSNGQDGNFYNENGDINLMSGNFATNFVELGLIKSSYGNQLNTFKFFKSSVEIHPKSWMLDEMQGKYSGLRWHNTFLAYKLPMDGEFNKSQKSNFSLKAETTLMIDNVNNQEIFNLKRVNASLTFYYHPKFLEDIGLFVQFYHGADYYNIYFNHQIDTIRFGLMTEVLRF